MSLFTRCTVAGCAQGQVQDLVLLGAPYLCAQHQAEETRRHAHLAKLKAQYAQSLGDQLPIEPAARKRLEYVRSLVRSGRLTG